MPAFGVVGFLAVGVAALFEGPRARAVQLGLCGVAGAAGAALLVAQGLLGHLCPYCCAADASGILSAVVAALRWSAARGAPSPPGLTYATAGSLVLALFAPLYAGFRAPGLPPAIGDEIAQTPSGVVTVVDFVDFECPFCRMMHAELAPLLALHRDRVRIVRRQVPLSMHPHARDAARAACCAETFGKGEPMANALFAAPVDDLTREGCEHIAEGIGLPLDPYRACVADPATDIRIEADRAEFKAAGGYALPTIWIGREQLVGAQPPEVLGRAIDGALARAGS